MLRELYKAAKRAKAEAGPNPYPMPAAAAAASGPPPTAVRRTTTTTVAPAAKTKAAIPTGIVPGATTLTEGIRRRQRVMDEL